MKVPNSKEIANHVVPESCVAYREVRGEALTGVRTGQPLSRESTLFSGADVVLLTEGNTYKLLIRRATLMARHSRVNSSISGISRSLRPSWVWASTKS